MALHLQNPVDIIWDFGGNLRQRNRQFGQLLFALDGDIGLPLCEQHFGLEDKSVTDNPDIVASTKDITQPAKKFRTEALQFLHTRCQRVVQRFTKAGDGYLVPRGLSFLLGQQGGQLLHAKPQRGQGIGQLDHLRLRGGIFLFKLADPGP